MIVIRPARTTPVDHRVFHLAVAAKEDTIVALTPDGQGTLIAQGMSFPLRVPDTPRQIAVATSGRILAIASDTGLAVVDTRSQVVLARESGAFQGCHFSVDGASLWVAKRPALGQALIELRDSSSLKVLGDTRFRDPFDGSSVMLLPNPRLGAVTVWAAAGQDGQALFQVEAPQKRPCCSRLTDLDEVSPPDFAPDGSSFVVIAGSGEIRQHSYPQALLLRAIPWPFEDADDQIGDSVFFAGPDHAMVETSSGRLYLVDLVRERYAEEMALLGHEPRAIQDLYPGLHGEAGLGADLSFVVNAGNGTYLSVHRRLPDSDSEWRVQLLQWRLDAHRRESV